MRILNRDISIKKIKPKMLDAAWVQQFLNTWGIYTQQEGDDRAFIEKGYRQNPTIYSIVSMITKNAIRARWSVYKINSDGTKEKHDDVLLQALLDRPNAMATWDDIIKEAIGFQLLNGNTFFWGIPPETNGITSGTVNSLWVLPSQHMQIVPREDNMDIAGYMLDYFNAGTKHTIDKEEVLHLKEWNPHYESTGSFLYGQSPLMAATRAMFTANESQLTQEKYLQNMGPQGVLGIEAAEGAQITEHSARALKEEFRKRHQGAKNAGDFPVSPIKATWTEMGMSAVDLELLKGYEMNKIDICQVYNFPPLLIGLTESTYANQGEARKALWNNCIIPELERIKKGLNMWLAPRYGENICLDFDLSQIKELEEDKQKLTNQLKESYWMTPNEKREMMGLTQSQDPDMDKIYMPSGLTPIDEMALDMDTNFDEAKENDE